MANVWFKNCELMINLNQNLAWLSRQEVIYSSPVLDLDLFYVIYIACYSDYLYMSSFQLFGVRDQVSFTLILLTVFWINNNNNIRQHLVNL